MVKNVAVLLLRRKAVLVRPSNLPQWRNHVRASGCHGCEILMEATHSESFEEVSPCDMCVCTQSCPTLCDSIVAYQTPLFMEFSRHEYWTRLAFSSLGIFPTQGSNPPLLYRQVDLLLLHHSVIHAVIPSLPLKSACSLFAGSLKRHTAPGIETIQLCPGCMPLPPRAPTKCPPTHLLSIFSCILQKDL